MGAVDLKTNLARREVVSAIQEADIVVSTSKWEANSLVLLESMAAGTPWVSFDVGSARENIGGVVAGNLDDMANSITELVRDHDRRKSLGRVGRARIAAKHDWDSIADRYERLYESVFEHQVQACPR
jgi:glycosyltransferase involved in cell wall biosynthesis